MQIKEIETLLNPVVSVLGYVLWGLEWANEGRGVLRLYIDRPQGITIEDCEIVAKQVSAFLDVHDVVQGAYRLEVSSPGLDRPLFKPEQFGPYVGQFIRLKLRAAIEGRAKLKGMLLVSTAESIRLKVTPEEEVEIAHRDIRAARLIPIFDQGGLK